MDERDPALPVATLRPGGFFGRLTSLRGAVGRWARSRIRLGLTGRAAPFVLTAVVFSGMMFAMGYVADRANRAADAIDEMHRMQRARTAYEAAQSWAGYDLEVAEATPVETIDDPWPSATPTAPVATPLFYIRGR